MISINFISYSKTTLFYLYKNDNLNQFVGNKFISEFKDFYTRRI